MKTLKKVNWELRLAKVLDKIFSSNWFWALFATWLFIALYDVIADFIKLLR